MRKTIYIVWAESELFDGGGKEGTCVWANAHSSLAKAREQFDETDKTRGIIRVNYSDDVPGGRPVIRQVKLGEGGE